jgi:hypothetical protein
MAVSECASSCAAICACTGLHIREYQQGRRAVFLLAGPIVVVAFGLVQCHWYSMRLPVAVAVGTVGAVVRDWKDVACSSSACRSLLIEFPLAGPLQRLFVASLYSPVLLSVAAKYMQRATQT